MKYMIGCLYRHAIIGNNEIMIDRLGKGVCKNYTVFTLCGLCAVPLLYVDFNEIIAEGLVLLSQSNSKCDLMGHKIPLYQGLAICGYMEDDDINGNRDDLVAAGICVANGTGIYPYVPWLLRYERVYFVSELLGEYL